MAKEKEKKHTRAPGMTQISISLPVDLVDKVDRLADAESRSRSNYIAWVLDRLPEPSVKADFLHAAEPRSKFNSAN